MWPERPRAPLFVLATNVMIAPQRSGPIARTAL
jgi:hypothetical protein